MAKERAPEMAKHKHQTQYQSLNLWGQQCAWRSHIKELEMLFGERCAQAFSRAVIRAPKLMIIEQPPYCYEHIEMPSLQIQSYYRAI